MPQQGIRDSDLVSIPGSLSQTINTNIFFYFGVLGTGQDLQYSSHITKDILIFLMVSFWIKYHNRMKFKCVFMARVKYRTAC